MLLSGSFGFRRTGFPVIEKILPAGAAARALGVSRATVRRWILSGALAGCMVGKRWYTTSAAVEGLKKRAAGTAQPAPAAKTSTDG
jgi:excisionase family DNA binding protein